MSRLNPFIVPPDVNADSYWYRNVYLNSRHWQWRRDIYMKRVGYYCEAMWNGRPCRSLGTQCHHLTYKNLFAEYDADLLLLCRRCHERMHKWPKAANDNGQLTFLFDALDQEKKSDTS